MIKAVLFDLDDTLYDHTHSLRTGLNSVKEKYDCFASYSLDELISEHLRLLDIIHKTQVLTGKLSVKEAREERFRIAFENFGCKSSKKLAAEAAEYYRINYESSRKLVDGSLGLLNALNKKIKIGIVSNNLVSQQEDKIKYFGLGKFIDTLVVSETAGFTKPDARIFKIALDNLGINPDEAVMIGDSWDEDIIGARNAGIKAIWFNRKNLPLKDEHIAIEIKSFNPPENVLNMIFNFVCL